MSKKRPVLYFILGYIILFIGIIFYLKDKSYIPMHYIMDISMDMILAFLQAGIFVPLCVASLLFTVKRQLFWCIATFVVSILLSNIIHYLYFANSYLNVNEYYTNIYRLYLGMTWIQVPNIIAFITSCLISKMLPKIKHEQAG
jgi:hypothetical protein